MATYRGRKLTPIEDAALEVLVNKLAPNPEDYRIDDVNEDVHPMGVHVKEVPGKKVEGLPAFKVTKVGSKVKEHGGLKVGEHIHDNHIDDLVDMGHKIKTEEVDQIDEFDMKEKDPEKHKQSQKYHYELGKKTAKAGKPKGETSDNYGPYASDYEQGYHDHMKEENQPKSLADLAAEAISLQKEGAFKSMVTDKMTSGKGMSYDKAVKAAEKDLKQGKNLPTTKLKK